MSVDQLLVLPGLGGRGLVEVREGDGGDMVIITRQSRIGIYNMEVRVACVGRAPCPVSLQDLCLVSLQDPYLISLQDHAESPYRVRACSTIQYSLAQYSSVQYSTVVVAVA